MKRLCDSCLRRPGNHLVVLRGVAFLVCSGCAPIVKRGAA